MHASTITIGLIIAAAVAAQDSLAQSPELLATLAPDDPREQALLGASIDIAAGHIVVGAPEEDLDLASNPSPGPGAAYVFDATSGAQLLKLTAFDGEPADRFGADVAIGDGIIAVGAPGDDDLGQNAGAVYIFDLSSGVQLVKLRPADLENDARFGTSLDIDAGVLAVPNTKTLAEAVYIFQTSTLIQTDVLHPTSVAGGFGASTAVGEGFVLVGAPFGFSGTGSVWVFDLPTGQATQIRPDDPEEPLSFGDAVDVRDGVIAVGTRSDIADADGNFPPGLAYIFDAQSFNQRYRLLPSPDLSGCCTSVAITDDTLAVGDFRTIYLFDTRSGQALGTIDPDGPFFPNTLAADAQILAAGDPIDDAAATNAGTALAYELPIADCVNVELTPNCPLRALDFTLDQDLLILEVNQTQGQCNITLEELEPGFPVPVRVTGTVLADPAPADLVFNATVTATNLTADDIAQVSVGGDIVQTFQNGVTDISVNVPQGEQLEFLLSPLLGDFVLLPGTLTVTDISITSALPDNPPVRLAEDFVWGPRDNDLDTGARTAEGPCLAILGSDDTEFGRTSLVTTSATPLLIHATLDFDNSDTNNSDISQDFGGYSIGPTGSERLDVNGNERQSPIPVSFAVPADTTFGFYVRTNGAGTTNSRGKLLIQDLRAFPIDADIVDGRRIGALATPFPLQKINSTFGDDTDPDQTEGNGAELDGLFVNTNAADGLFRFGITGNFPADTTFQNDGWVILLDTTPGGENTLDANGGLDQSTSPLLPSLEGTVLDESFTPDRAITIASTDGVNFTAEFANLRDNTARVLGSNAFGSGDGTLVGGDNPSGILAAFDNSNTEGVGSPPGQLNREALSATTGLEVRIPITDLGFDSTLQQRIGFLAILTGGDPIFPSNQTLPPLPVGTGTPSAPIDFTQFDQLQFSFFFIDPPAATPCPGDANNTGDVNAADLLLVLGNFGSVVTPGTDGDVSPLGDPDGSVNAADLLTVLGNFGNSCG